MAQKRKFYVVRNGHKPGIYRTWEECRKQVEGYSNAVYKSFFILRDAEEFLHGCGPAKALPSGILETETAATIPQFLPGPAGHGATLKQVFIYADGACMGNPGPGGYGVVILHGGERRELSAGFRLTTNNRMEILGCIAGLRALKECCDVTIYSDSKYVVNTMTKSWALRWRKQGWRRKDENGEFTDVRSPDLWAQMLDLCDKHRVRFSWVRGHSGNDGNERCDQLARTAAAAGMLGIDVIYENAPPDAGLPNTEQSGSRHGSRISHQGRHRQGGRPA